MKKITLPYGHEQRVIEIPEENLAWIEGPRHAPPIPDIPAAVRHAIRNPIGSPTLAELVAKHGKRTLHPHRRQHTKHPAKARSCPSFSMN